VQNQGNLRLGKEASEARPPRLYFVLRAHDRDCVVVAILGGGTCYSIYREYGFPLWYIQRLETFRP
jgi:hypothetical protein